MKLKEVVRHRTYMPFLTKERGFWLTRMVNCEVTRKYVVETNGISGLF